jgi:hypothetical protein
LSNHAAGLAREPAIGKDGGANAPPLAGHYRKTVTVLQDSRFGTAELP